LFKANAVDLYLSAHLNAYERTYPVFSRSICKADGSSNPGEQEHCTVYVVNGDAGVPALEYEALPASWTAKRHWGTPGYGELVIHNATHLQYRQLEADHDVSDEFWLKKGTGPREAQEENFIEAVGWAAFATAVVGVTMAFVTWAHNDGIKKHGQAIRDLRNELRVLGVSDKIIGPEEEEEDLVNDEPAPGMH